MSKITRILETTFRQCPTTSTRFKERRWKGRIVAGGGSYTPRSLWIFHFEMSTCLKSWRIFNVFESLHERYVYQLLLPRAYSVLSIKFPPLFSICFLTRSLWYLALNKNLFPTGSRLLQRRIPLMMLDNLILSEKKIYTLQLYSITFLVSSRQSRPLWGERTRNGIFNEGNFMRPTEILLKNSIHRGSA